jgi:hypothetical protein
MNNNSSPSGAAGAAVTARALLGPQSSVKSINDQNKLNFNVFGGISTCHSVEAVGVGGTGSKWHGMKARFRPLFANVELVEDWYNRLATPKLKEKFRTMTKSLLAVPPEQIGRQVHSDVDPAKWHRANHILKLYGEVFTPQAQDRVVAFLARCSQAEADAFGDSVNSIQTSMPAKTVTKSAWLPQDRLADQPDRERFHKVIEWTSVTAAEKVRDGYVNPMDQRRLGLKEHKSTREETDEALAAVPTQLKMGQKKTIGALQSLMESARSVGEKKRLEAMLSDEGSISTREIAEIASELTKKKKSHLEMTGGRYEVDAHSGATLFQVRGNAMSSQWANKGQASMKERIVSASGIPSSSWKSTAKDHFPNLSHGQTEGMGRVNPEQHPCVARYTAATCMVVPSLKAKVAVTGASSRGLRM